MLRKFLQLSLVFLFAACQADINTTDWVDVARHEESLRAQKELQAQVDSLEDLLAQLKADTSRYEIPPPNHDSLMRAMEEKMDLEVKAPALFTNATVSEVQSRQFKNLATTTGGKLTVLSKSDEIQEVIGDLIRKYGDDGLDLMIIMDKTGSMSDDLIQVKEGLKDILRGMSLYPNSRLAMATYGDKHVDKEDWYSFESFEEEHARMGAHIESISVTGGGDYKESVYDGVYRALEEGFFRSRSRRMVILIGDAPGHEGKKSEYSLRDILRISRRDRIKMIFYPIIIHPGKRSLTGGSSRKSDQGAMIESIYPNPSTGVANLRFYEAQPLEVTIYNQNGTVVRNYSFAQKELRIDLSDKEAGLYLIRAVYKGKIFDQRKLLLKF